MNVNNTNAQKGFTIIEVVLVLAIAGLIFLMVFIALPALQRNQRDTARKSDVSTVSSAVNSFTGNNRGSYPTDAQLQSYTKDLSDNTDNSKVTIISYITGTTTYSIGEEAIKVVKGAKCGATGVAASGATTANQTLAVGSKRQYVTIGFLEAGGGTTYCLES